jgi:hypothetical protein
MPFLQGLFALSEMSSNDPGCVKTLAAGQGKQW